MLTYLESIIFIELKESKQIANKWLPKAKEQLKNTISHFKNNHDLKSYSSKRAYVSNKLRQISAVSQIENIQRFKDETGFILSITTTITI